MGSNDLRVMFWIVVTAFLVAMFVRSVRAYETVDEPCDSGGLEVCDMQPLVLPDMWRYQCGTLPLPEVYWCTERRQRR